MRQAAIREDVDNIKNNTGKIEKVKFKQVEAEESRSLDRYTIFEELQERENHKDNLVIHQVPEPPAFLTRGADRKNHDTKYALDILGALDCKLRAEELKFIFRPGERKEDGRSRPLIFG